MATHEIERGEVRAIGRGGEAVVETASGIVFVPGALPGEELELKRSGSKRGAARGQLTRLLRRSAQRVDPICPHVHRCGGCPLMIADAELQREIKLGFLREACRGLRGAEETRVEWVPSPTTLAYRRRARMSWHGSTLGYRALPQTPDAEEAARAAESRAEQQRGSEHTTGAAGPQGHRCSDHLQR